MNATTPSPPGPSSAASSAPTSSYGTSTKPGAYGPKPRRALGSELDETAAIVRPQKLWRATTTVARSGATPFTSYPQRRLSLIAVSPPSTPVFIGSTRS